MVHLNAYTYSLSCTKRGQVYFQSGERPGLFLRVMRGGDQIGIGEYAPIFGFHHYAIADVITMAQSFNDLSVIEAQDLSHLELANAFSAMPRPLGYMLSMAHLHCSFTSHENLHSSSSIKLSALIETSTVNDAIMTAQGYVAQGFTTLKIKVGSLPIKDEIIKIKTIAAIGGSDLSIRLDANRRLDLLDAILLINGLKRVSLEYFEEPLIDMNDATNLYEATGISIAVDESVYDGKNLSCDAIKFVIIKPSRFASIYEVMLMTEQAKKCGQIPIFSHCFESEYTAAIFSRLIDKLGLHDRAHGVLAEGFFKQGILNEPLRSFRGRLFFDSCHKAVNGNIFSSPLLSRVF